MNDIIKKREKADLIGTKGMLNKADSEYRAMTEGEKQKRKRLDEEATLIFLASI